MCYYSMQQSVHIKIDLHARNSITLAQSLEHSGRNPPNLPRKSEWRDYLSQAFALLRRPRFPNPRPHEPQATFRPLRGITD